MLNPEFKKKWCDALRSGEYIKNRFGIRSMNGKLCCIGVGAEVAKKGSVLDNSCPTTDDAALECGIAYHDIQTLVDLNDKDNKSFPEIADWIEANL